MKDILFFRKNKIKRKIFKKNTILINKVKFKKLDKLKICTIIYIYVKYYFSIINRSNFIDKNYLLKDTFLLNISQNTSNNKSILTQKRNLHTFSIGSILKYFKVKQGKYVRRSLKGLKIFLNFLKNFLKKNFLKKNGNTKNFVLTVNGFDYNMCFLKKNLKGFFYKKDIFCFFIFNLKISFTKKKDKKIKSIKKRLKKKIILTFTKANKIK